MSRNFYMCINYTSDPDVPWILESSLCLEISVLILGTVWLFYYSIAPTTDLYSLVKDHLHYSANPKFLSSLIGLFNVSTSSYSSSSRLCKFRDTCRTYFQCLQVFVVIPTHTHVNTCVRIRTRMFNKCHWLFFSYHSPFLPTLFDPPTVSSGE